MPIGIYKHECRPLADRFWAKVKRAGEDECWVWTASIMRSNGYGQCRVGDKTRLAHRLAYELMVGPIPEGLQIDHLCKNKRCVNPKHLEVVTHAINNLRSDSFSAVNARKTHCSRGHEFTPENTYRKPGKDRRECRACAAIRDRKRIR